MGGSWPIGFLLREVFDTTNNYANAVSCLAQTSLIAPCYFTCCGINPGEGDLITRNPNGEENRWNLEEHGIIVQPNMDHWSDDPDQDIMDSETRRTLCRALLDGLNPENLSEETLWEIMSTDPICNEITVYGTYMLPSASIIKTRIPSLWTQFRPFERQFGNEIPNLIILPLGEEISNLIEKPEDPICVNCNAQFNVLRNKKGKCAHTGKWHASIGDCGIKCIKLGRKLGYQHWSCCYDNTEHCRSSKKHVSPNEC
eukprot:TRINITY_DN8559_c0_g1_i2.p1 TRINITY_DN8559_c0_g1~~TRINITY_DN8559_c0_g1_i2.p1  ORF type:complete len:256 (-),score=46.16 TRINITY_DN8559_c0_g1_i2:54-821(-)